MADMSMQDIHHICCFGATKLGVVSTVVAATKWPDKNFVIVDSQETIDRWTTANPPYFEPQLPELVADRTQANVVFQAPNYHQVKNAQMVIIAVDVNTKEAGLGKRKRLDLQNWDPVMRKVLAEATQPKCIIIKSHLPVDSAIEALQNIISDIQPANAVARDHHIFWVPEIFSRGTAVQNVLHPARVVIAPYYPRDNPNTTLIVDYYSTPINWVANNQIITTSISSGIMGVMSKNVMLAIEATMINIMSELCEELPDGDVNVVRQIIVTDPRLDGDQSLNVSAGFGGPELLRDLTFFTHLAELYHNKSAAQLFRSIISCNTQHQQRLASKILQSMNAQENDIICILGFSYKENTNEVVNSAAIEICRTLCKNGATQIRIYDPHVHTNDITQCFARKYVEGQDPRISVKQNLNDMWHNAGAICLLHNGEPFNDLVWQQIYEQAQGHAPQQYRSVVHVFDTCNVLQGQQLQNIRQVNVGDRPMFKLHIQGRPAIQ